MKKRIKTINLLIGASKLSGDPETVGITNEFDEVVRVNNISPLKRRWLLQVLHSTRATDSALAALLRVLGITVLPTEKSIGKYLKKLATHTVSGVGKLTPAERTHFQRQIADPRNKYMHSAGANPAGANEIQMLLGEMHACLVRALHL